jgi:hypothetical protein
MPVGYDPLHSSPSKQQPVFGSLVGGNILALTGVNTSDDVGSADLRLVTT